MPRIKASCTAVAHCTAVAQFANKRAVHVVYNCSRVSLVTCHPCHLNPVLVSASTAYVGIILILRIISPFLNSCFRSVRVCSSHLAFGENDVYGKGFTCYKYTVWCIPAFRDVKEDSVVRTLFDLGSDPHELVDR